MKCFTLGVQRAKTQPKFAPLRAADLSREPAEMLYKCANPACSRPFRRLDEGKLFQVETEYFPASESRQALPSKRGRMLRHHVERYWLCDDCCSTLTLTFEQGR